ncbi:MAG: tyrosine-type recombinase/integrase [Acidimicrobiales bacterium]
MAGRRTSGEGSVYQRGHRDGKGDGRWVAALSVPGRPRVLLYGATKKQVLEKRKEAERRLAEGLPATDKVVTVNTLFSEWLASLQLRRSANTVRYYRSTANTHILPFIGEHKVNALKPQDIEKLIARAAERGYSNSVVRRIRIVMAAALKFGIKNRYCARNVAFDVDPVPEEHKEGRTLTPEQCKVLLAAFAAHERFGAAWTTMLGLGLRRQETLNLRWSDVDLERNSLTVHGKTKTRASVRSVDLPAFVHDALVEHRRRHPGVGDAWLFPNTVGRQQDPGEFYNQFVKCADAALGEHINPHLCRHTAASLMLASGVPLQVVSKVLGHSSIAVTSDLYSHLLPAAFANAAAGMDEMVRSAK